MAGAIHHTVIACRDIGASLTFYRDGLGLDVLADREVEGDWPELFGAPSRQLRAIFLGDPTVDDVSAGVLELNGFAGEIAAAPDPALHQGFSMISFFVDVDATLQRLAELNLGGTPRRVAQPTPYGPLAIATVRDPDGAMVLLTPGSITRSR
jgi:catechol 2,3-dioxygenase-like lactoylglutathione lyase family enzyme